MLSENQLSFLSLHVAYGFDFLGGESVTAMLRCNAL